MTKISLIVPPLVTNKGDLKKAAINQATFYLGSYLKNRGHDVQLLDTIFEGWDNLRSEDEETQTFGLSDKDIVKKVKNFEPDVIGVNCVATVNYNSFQHTIKLLKTSFPNSVLVAGGSHTNALAEKTLRDAEGNLDYLGLSEGEKILENIASKIGNHSELQKIKGIAYLSEGKFNSNPLEDLVRPLDSIGDLDMDLIKDIPYTPEPTYAGSTSGKKYIDVMFSRGCHNNCTFCTTPQMWRRKIRRHGLDWISRQLDSFKEQGIGHIIVQDDYVPTRGTWIENIMKLFKEKGFTWEDNGGMMVEDLTPEYIHKMSDSGCKTLFVPLNLRGEESLNGSNLSFVAENTNTIPEKLLNHYKKILGTAKERDMRIYSSHIFGYPEQTLKGMDQQAEVGKSLVDEGYSDFHVLYAFSVLPGTHRWNQIMKPTGNGEYKVRPESGVDFEWTKWNRYSVNTPQIGSRNFTYGEAKKKYYELIRYVNGDKAEAWFNGREWPK